MLAKLTAKNQLTLPKAATQAVQAGDYFEVEVRAGQIILTPVRLQRGDAVRAKLTDLDITPTDVADAVAWARATPLRVPARVSDPAAPYEGGAKKPRRKPAPRA